MKKIFVTLLLITLFSFKLADMRSIYNIPMQANAVCAVDYDLDGDMDLIISHGINKYTYWGGIYMMKNDGYGHFMFLDSIYDTTGWVIYADTVFSKTYYDLIFQIPNRINILTTDGENYTESSFCLGEHVNDFALGDVDGNGFLDVVFISSLEQYWGIIYNQGNDSFSSPTYYEMDNVPGDITCGDLNNDGRSDILIGSLLCEIWYSTESDFSKQILNYSGSNVSINDLDNDGDKDIITFSDLYAAGICCMYENRGNNIFDSVNSFRVPEGCSDFFVTDFNNDSLPDALFLTYNFNEKGYILYYNQGNFHMGEAQVIPIKYYGEARRFMYCADMDGNGYTDIITTRQVFDTTVAPSSLEILFNDGHGNFVENPLTGTEKNLSSDNIALTCYPNPFTEKTTIKYTINEKCNTTVSVCDLNGRKIKTLFNNKFTIGNQKTTWDGTDQNGKEVTNGTYLIRLQAGRQVTTRTVVKIN